MDFVCCVSPIILNLFLGGGGGGLPLIKLLIALHFFSFFVIGDGAIMENHAGVFLSQRRGGEGRKEERERERKQKTAKSRTQRKL
mmetsp:Transcript_30020/g.41849  ORF Transcript_30020/g.41849 Transcript_30020/m.41849 type:complete len:85 (+) Transcript_30020:790-1044(+)